MLTQSTCSRASLLGLTETGLVAVADLSCQLHAVVVEPLLCLRESAFQAGFCLQVASSFRSCERQVQIWNAKASGHRPVLDSRGQPLDLGQFTDLQKVEAIMRWSALPGSSRHHWGTDLDIYDGSTLAANYRVQLTHDECCGHGPFAAFHQWLSLTIAAGESFGFYRPYAIDTGGVAPEPWHLSYAPLADKFARQRTEAMLRDHVEALDIALKPTILAHFSELYRRFIQIAE